MSLAIIVLVVALVGSVVAGLATRQRRLIESRWLIGIALIFAVCGIWLVVWNTGDILKARAIKHWPTVTGSVVQSEIIGSRAIRPLIVYKYRVGESEFIDSSSLGIPSFGNRRIRLDESEKLTAEYALGDTVTVHYNVDNPRQSLLYAREDWAEYMRLSLGVMLFALGVFGLTHWIFRPAKEPTAS
jgi:hypothetical protein